jgi:hypothetical protein
VRVTKEQKRTFRFLPLTIGLETLGGVSTPLVLRGTPLPAHRVETFSTAANQQTSVEIKILMGESGLAQRNVLLGSFHMKEIPPAPKGSAQIEVSFDVDTACGVTARARLGKDVKAEQRFSPPADMSAEAVTRMIAAAEASKHDDEIELQRLEIKNEANEVLNQAEKALASTANAELSRAVAELGLALQSDQLPEIRKRTDDLRGRLVLPSLFDLDFFGPTKQKSPNSSSGRPTTAPFGGFFGESPKTGPTTATKPTRVEAKPKARAPDSASKGPLGDELTAAPHTPALGKIFGGGGNFTLDAQLCFVLMPFSIKFQPIYEDHIKPTIEAAGLVCQRADEVLGASVIAWDIWERINRARFLIADLTDQNSNVFYELGLAHALSKDVILLTQSMDFVPFDLKAVRCLVYDYTPRGMEKMQATLRITIDTVMKSG